MATVLPELVPLRVPSAGPESSRSTSRRGSEYAESTLSELSFASTSASLKSQRGSRFAKAGFSAVASRELREFSRSRRLLQPEAEQTEAMPSLEELEQDLTGWNGKWKQKKAVALIAERRRMQLAEEMEQKLVEQEKRQRLQEQREWMRRAKEEEEKALLAEAKRHEAKERSLRAACSWRNFCRRVLEEEDCLMSHLREPVPCVPCRGSGLCVSCGGTGSLSVTYLAASVAGGHGCAEKFTDGTGTAAVHAGESVTALRKKEVLPSTQAQGAAQSVLAMGSFGLTWEKSWKGERR
eukprot:CAMPEP_0197651764 /NCGR_PEP_ID=MMETSP1338-20131121/34038_1 /TAXON_ID=43686 ORGANISM="Pelagodinium beii, Strain RCC1491" /NCGR_SAMPLE_ID=MMETSP1338 /ASSEMBLY_ACC=CAM_ASM_000754 /LENGTH=294 /DNA_ID=CAMNT_0043226495 /DNA_START=52 /DNA_END=937 /DNA_ORIENTATION=+